VYPVVSVVRDDKLSELFNEALSGHEEDTIVGTNKANLGAVIVDSVFPDWI
jgi:hypothetical protein